MKYILYILSFFCLLIGGGAWFFYNHPVGVIGIILSLYILYRLERQPHTLSLKWPGSRGKGASRDQAAFEKAVTDFNRMEAERWGLTDLDLRRTIDNMQHIARNFLYYLQQYPDRIGLAEHFIDYYQDRAVFMVRKYKKLSATGLKTDKVIHTQKKLKTLLIQLDQAYEEQFTQVLEAELVTIDLIFPLFLAILNLEAELVTIDGETTVMAHNLSADGLYDPDAAVRRKKPSSLKGSFSQWKQKAADRFDAYTDGSFSSITPELRHKINEERLITAVLAFFLGSFGIHYFYLKRPVRGAVYALFCWTLIPGFLGLREGIRYFNMTTDEFYYADYLHKYGA